MLMRCGKSIATASSYSPASERGQKYSSSSSFTSSVEMRLVSPAPSASQPRSSITTCRSSIPLFDSALPTPQEFMRSQAYCSESMP